jgi:hypothetical protein
VLARHRDKYLFIDVATQTWPIIEQMFKIVKFERAVEAIAGLVLRWHGWPPGVRHAVHHTPDHVAVGVVRLDHPVHCRNGVDMVEIRNCRVYAFPSSVFTSRLPMGLLRGHGKKT